MNVRSKLMIAIRGYGFERTFQTLLHALAGGSARPLWDVDARFCSLFELVNNHTLVNKKRAFMIYQFARHAACLPGHFSEIGVYRGGTARLLAELRGPKMLFLFDTFTGMPATGRSDFVQSGDFADTSFEAVKRFVGMSDSIRYFPGYFPETAEPIRHETFSLVHIDVDRAESARDCCTFFYPRLTPGGMLLFDDYGHAACAALTTAVDHFFVDKPEAVVYLPTGQALVIKS